MRILYSVHGYGRGHATRTLSVLPHLNRQHQVLVLAGGDAYSAIWPDYQVVRIPTLGFAYGYKTGKRSNLQTFRRNFPAVLDLLLGGPVFDMVQNVIHEFSPDVIISDAEPWSHQVGKAMRIPRISFDHIGIMVYCKPEMDWHDHLEATIDRWVYRLLMGNPERILVSSFFSATPRRPDVCVVGTLLRKIVLEMSPKQGDHLLVYFNRGQQQLTSSMLHTLNELGRPIHVYGTDQEGRRGRLHFLPLSNLPFLEDLATCRAVLSTAGNQLMGEAIHLRKPVLVMPERCVEQRLNAAAVERLGIGMRVTQKQFTVEKINAFLQRHDSYQHNIQRLSQNGLEEALTAIDQFLRELVPDVTRQQIVQTPVLR